MNDLSKALTILSSMIAPVVLIMACGSLILTTSQRLSRIIERSRKLTEHLKELIHKSINKQEAHEEAQALFSQLDKAARRAKLLQKAMACLYLTLSFFVATSVMLGLTDISHITQTWIPIVLGIMGTLMLFYASILLIIESRMAVIAVNEEMSYAIRYFKQHFPQLKDTAKNTLAQRLITIFRN